MSEHAVADVVDVLRAEMTSAGDAEDFDLSIDDETGMIELATDDWTLQIDGVGADAIAYLSIDNEPDHAEDYPSAIRNAFRPLEIVALGRANVSLEELLSDALVRSGDPISSFLATRLPGPSAGVV
jgi:hypothetical protein